jgi:hypothetical protein
LALLLVAGTFLLTSIQRFGIHAARTSHDISNLELSWSRWQPDN